MKIMRLSIFSVWLVGGLSYWWYLSSDLLLRTTGLMACLTERSLDDGEVVCVMMCLFRSWQLMMVDEAEQSPKFDDGR